MDTPSPDSASDVVTHLNQCCEVGHRVFNRIGEVHATQDKPMEPITATVVIVALLALAC